MGQPFSPHWKLRESTLWYILRSFRLRLKNVSSLVNLDSIGVNIISPLELIIRVNFIFPHHLEDR
jgi:hypothetical protein